MSVLLRQWLVFGIAVNTSGTWDAWIRLHDGGRAQRGGMESIAVAFAWIEATVATWEAAA